MLLTPLTIPPAAIVFLDVQNWPLWVMTVFMVVAADLNHRTLRVPNRLSLAGILSACLVGLLLSTGLIEGPGGSLLSVLPSLLIGGMVLLPLYAMGGLGAGCVKMQAAYGAWLGCAFPIEKAASLTCITSLAGAICCFIVALIVRLNRRNLPEDSIQLVLLPAQEVLSAGSVISLVVWLQFMA